MTSTVLQARREPGTSLVLRRRTGLVLGLAALVVLATVSLMVGSRTIPLDTSVVAITSYDPTNDLHLVVRELRIPRTILGVVVGAALGLAGALMQALTRNPLAEPGMLGINAGAAAAVVVGVTYFGVTNVGGYVWFAFLGAGLAGVAVFLLGRAHDAGTNPVRLVLAGVGLTVMLGAFTWIVVVNAPERTLEVFRAWETGSLAGRGMDVVPVVVAAVAVGALICGALAPSLNAVALGSDLGVALGVRARRTWVLATIALLLLAGSATAAAGPIAFVGLAAPHLARLAVGTDQRWILAYSALFAAVVLVAADVLGRVVAHPAEMGAGVMAAIIGGPFFVALVRRRRLPHA